MEAQRYLEALDAKLKEFLPENPNENNKESATVVAEDYVGSFKAGEHLGSVASNSSDSLYNLPHVTMFTIHTL